MIQIKYLKERFRNYHKMNVQIASQQPPTTAKVILYTSHGEIDIELWAKEAPLACKNFIQHCLNGYYLNTIFHRLIPGFMIQGGDPTGTGMGGQSIYDGPFRDQFHQRLKFTRRGIVAMANAGKNTNKSQFFMTFGPCQHLNKKHTIFGKVVGDTIYNLMGLQSLDTGEQDRPLDPPIIRRIKVVQNPFSELKVPEQPLKKSQEQQGQKEVEKQAVKKQSLIKTKKQDLKKLKNKKKLTFDDQEEIGETSVHKVISSHDVLYKKDASISNKLSITKEQIEKKRKQKEMQEKKASQIKNSLHFNKQQNQEENQQNQDVTTMISKQMTKKRAHFEQNQSNLELQDSNLNHIKRFNPTTNKYEIVFKDQLDRQQAERQRQQELERKAKQQQEITDEKLRQVREMQLQEYNRMKADELSFKKAKEGSMKEKRKEIIHEEKKLLSNLQKHRYEFMKKQQMDQHEGQLFKKLMDFSSRLKSESKSKTIKENTQRRGKESLDNSWMNHQLKFHIDSTNAYSLEEKAMRVNKNYQDQDDGGLKMEVQYNNFQDEEQDKQLEKVLKEL